jgi:type II secretory pathway component GspD/PulD (secretin)
MKIRLRILCLTAASTVLLLAAPFSPVRAASAVSVKNLAGNDSLITMNVKNMPLGEVLEKIEEATDLKFNIDEQWKDIPVSVTLDNAHLDKALKRILVNLNNVVIYGANDQVKIVVFGKAEPGGPSGRPAGPPSYKQPLPMPQPPPLPDENPSVSEEPEPESIPTPEESVEAPPDDQGQQTQESTAEGQADGAESGAQKEPTAEGGAPQEGQPAGQQAE